MAVYLKKDRAEILRQALRKLETNTSVKAVGPGSVARAFAEGITTEIGDLYDAMDFALGQAVISKASGRSLDLLGELYNVRRRTLTELATIDAQVGAFYFYLDAAHDDNITIPAGTKVYTSTQSFIGRQLSFVTTAAVLIPAGRTRVFASIKPDFSDSVFTAGVGTLTVHDFPSPSGARVRCTNPKAIAPQQGYEGDSEYRVRIIKQIKVNAAGTLEAVRFAALSVFGVRDARVRNTPYGLGSFEMIITPEDNSLGAKVRRDVETAVQSTRPAGVRMYTRLPETVPMDITASLIIKTGTGADADAASNRAQVAIIRYLNSLLPGENLVYNRLIQSILDSSEFILDVQLTRYAPNGVEALRRNYTPKEEEQVIPGRIVVSVA